MAASMVTSTSASFGTGLSVDSSRARRSAGHRRPSCRSHEGERGPEQMASWVGTEGCGPSWRVFEFCFTGHYDSLIGAEFSWNVPFRAPEYGRTEFE